MILKKLELIGFKSFADRTEFDFESGITAIVGPNGCGKSNVVDAVKWILGEQSVKSLRGKEMSDVIFSGTPNRKSLGYAEATLTMDNADRRLKLDFDEVAITRRIYRTGEGAYFINKKPCRLKDIKNLLLDTGMGMQCYSVIEQGKIDQILVTSTAERRRVFDEAAGISKYKARRKEAQSKLERVERNLLRLGDIVDEVEKQLRSVKYQAAKARRFREYTDELKRLRVSYSLREYDRYAKHSAETGAKLRQSEDERTRLLTESDQADVSRHDVESRVMELETKQEEAQALLARVRQAALAAEDAIRFSRQRIREQGELETRYAQQASALEGRVAHMREELEQKGAELSGLLNTVEQEKQMLDEKMTAFTEIDTEARQIAENLEENRGAVVKMMQRQSQIENELGVVLSERRRLEIQRQRQAARLDEVGREMGVNEQGILKAEEEIAAVDRIIGQLIAQSAEKQTARRDLAARLGALRDEIGATLQHQGRLESRLDVLRDLNEKQEGIEQGVREVLSRMRESGGQVSGLHGMLGEAVTVEAKYARAVEAALGHRAQTLVVEHLDHAIEGVRVVNQAGQGRASFMPLSHCKAHLNGHELPLGVMGRVNEFIVCDDAHRRVVDCLLGDVLLVENMDRVRELKAAGANGFVLVTLDGEVMEPTGIVTGGKGISGGGIISRAAERRELEAQLEEVRVRLQTLQQTLERLQQDEAAIGGEIEHLAELVEGEKVTRGARLTAIERLRENQRMLGEEHKVLLSEQAEVERESGELSGRERELRIRLDGVKREDEELESRIGTLTQSHEEVSNRKLALQEDMTNLKITLARSREQQDGLRAAIENLGANLRIRQDELEQLRANIEEARAKQAEATEEISRREVELEESRAKEHEQQAVVLALTNRREEMREEMVNLEKISRELKTRLTELDQSVSDLRLEAQEVRLKMATLVERVQEDYQLDVQALYRDWQAEEMNWDEVAERIEDLKRKIANMGNVNLDAIQNEEELSRRAEFLGTQRTDLNEARRKLEEIIQRLNKQSLEMFQTSFGVIRENFQDMFRKLFGGGKADLFLENEQDVLESGIEIIARPPGKEPRAISLLSGGEKVMTAVALLFAIFKSKPSPFCLLDEVDAALDEANIGRFTNILQDFLAYSQFIIITHSKRTMATANVIYGITMQEQGVSKKIAVKFEDYEAQAVA